MPKLPLTDATIRALPHQTTQITYFDKSLRSFGVRVGARDKTFIVMRGTARNRVVLGKFHAYNGGGSTDTLDLSHITAPVTVNLGGIFGVGFATDSQIGLITLNSIENVVGGAGNDRITGSSGPNWIEGGAGNDRMSGDGGSDTFVFKPGFGKDVVTDFKVGKAGSNHDIIDLTGLGVSSFAELAAHLSEDAHHNAVLTFGGDTITLEGVHVTTRGGAHLIADDFRFH